MREMRSRRALCLQQGAIRAMFDRAASMEDVISLGIGEPDLPTPPEICAAAREALDAGITHYTPNAGLTELREALSEHYGAAGLSYDPGSEIIVTNGGMGALSTLMMVLLDEGDEVLIPDPQWLNHAAQVELCGGRAVRIPTDEAHGFAPQREAMEAVVTAKTKALLLNSPNNPTGMVLKNLEEIAAFAQEHDLLVISDEVYNTLLYDGAEPRSIASLPGMQERTMVINSCSKAFSMTGWRIGSAVGPAVLVDKMVKAQENLNACANAPGQHAAAYALRHPDLSRSLRDCFAARRQVLLEGLDGIPGLHFCRPDGAFYVFPDIRAFSMDSETFCRRLLEEERLVCIPGSAFGDCGEGHIRLSYTCCEAALQEAVRRLARFCERERHGSV